MASSRWSLRQQTPGIQLGKRLFASACPNFGSLRVGTGLRQRCGGEQNKSQRIATRRSALLFLCPCPYTDWPSRGSSLIPSLHIASIGCDCFSAKVVPSSLHLPNSLDDPGCFVQGLIQDWTRPETDFVPSRFDSTFFFFLNMGGQLTKAWRIGRTLRQIGGLVTGFVSLYPFRFGLELGVAGKAPIDLESSCLVFCSVVPSGERPYAKGKRTAPCFLDSPNHRKAARLAFRARLTARTRGRSRPGSSWGSCTRTGTGFTSTPPPEKKAKRQIP